MRTYTRTDITRECYDHTFGVVLEFLEEQFDTKKALAQALKIHPSTLRRWMNKDQQPDSTSILAMKRLAGEHGKYVVTVKNEHPDAFQYRYQWTLRGTPNQDLYDKMSQKELDDFLDEYHPQHGSKGPYARPVLQFKDLTGLSFRKAHIRRQRDGVSIREIVLRNCILCMTDFNTTDLSRASFTNCDCRNARFRNSVLYRVDFRKCDLLGADFHGADLKCAFMKDVNLHNVRFSDARLTQVHGLQYASIDWHKRGASGRTALAVNHGPEEGIVYHCGCFRGDWDKLVETCNLLDKSRRATRIKAAHMLRDLITDDT